MTVDPSNPPQSGQFEMNYALTHHWTVPRSIQTDLVVTTRDKIKVVMLENLPKFRQSIAWTGPGSLFLGMLLGLVTSDFDRGFLGLPHETWATVFWMGTIASGIWFCWSVFLVRRRSVSHEDILNAIFATHREETPQIIAGEVQDSP